MKLFSTKSLVAASLISSSVTLSAQDKGTTLGGFASIPVGKFGSTDLNDGGGFVKTGWGIVFDSKLRSESWADFFSLNLHSTYQWNQIDNGAVAEAYAADFAEIFPNYVVDFVEVGESRHAPIVLTLGPKFDIPLADGITLGVTAGVGVMFNNTKSFRLSYQLSPADPMDTSLTAFGFEDVIKFDNNPAFTYMLGLDLTFQVVDNLLDITLYADFNAANQTTEFELSDTEPVKSVEEMRYLNTGIKLTLYTP